MDAKAPEILKFNSHDTIKKPHNNGAFFNSTTDRILETSDKQTRHRPDPD